jgi:large subunit ribosomal protein L25
MVPMELAVQKREKLGRAAAALRKQGFIPAELYGHGVENLHLAVDAKEFRGVFKEAGENMVITLLLGNKEKRSAVVHDIQRNYIDQSIEHIDFYQVRMDEKLKAHVPVEFIGEAPAVKEQGGLLNKTVSEIEVESLPGDIPQRFTVDLAGLIELNQSIYVRDLAVPRGVKVLIDPETVLVTVTPPRKEEEVAPAPVADVSEVKVESEEKKVEREKDKQATEAE